MKQVKPVGRTMPPSTVAQAAGEGNQPAVEVGPIIGIVEVASGAPSLVFAQRKQYDGARVSGRKKSRVSLNLRALRRATRFTPPLPTKVSTPAVVVVVVPTTVVV